MTVTSEQPKALPLRQVQPDGAVLLTGLAIQFRVIVLKPGFMLLTAKGGAQSAQDAAAERAMMREFELELERSGMLTVFADLRETSRFGAETRETTVAWMRKHQARLNASHVLVRSKLIEMAITIVGMLVGGGIIKVYSRPQAFLEALQSVAPRIATLPVIR